MAYREVAGEGLRTWWDDQPVVLITNHRDSFGVVELSWATEPVRDGWVPRRTRVRFDGVAEYRWRYWDAEERAAVPEEGGLQLGELVDSERMRTLAEQEFRDDLRHFRIAFDEHGIYDVICLSIHIEYEPGREGWASRRTDGVALFRAAGPADFEAIGRLYHQLHPDEPVLSDRSGFERILASEHFRLCVLEVDGEVIGTTYLNLVPNLTRGSKPYAVIENVVVDESRRGTGLGKQLMAGTLQAAWDAGCYKAMLMTGSKRESTHAFYRACGFSPDAKQAYVARPPA